MRKLTVACLFAAVVTASGTVLATEYFGIDQSFGGDVELALEYCDPDFVVGADYQVYRFDWSITNNGLNTYYDLWLVLPFAWLQVDGVLRAYSYDDGTDNWHWTDGVDDFYLAPEPDDSPYVPPPADTEFRQYDLIQSPVLECDLSGQPAVVCGTDTVPWTCATLDNPFKPGETSTFTMYLRQQTDSRVSGLWLQPYTVAAIPEPATLLLVVFGAAGLLLVRRKR